MKHEIRLTKDSPEYELKSEPSFGDQYFRIGVISFPTEGCEVFLVYDEDGTERTVRATTISPMTFAIQNSDKVKRIALKAVFDPAKEWAEDGDLVEIEFFDFLVQEALPKGIMIVGPGIF